MGCVRVKDGVQFTVIAPGGFRILSALDQCALTMGRDLTITSACDGLHAGSLDPHHRGEAYDVRSQNLTSLEKQEVLSLVMDDLSRTAADVPTRVGAGLATMSFYGFLEDVNAPNEHLHFQVRRGCCWPPEDRPARTGAMTA